MKTLFCFALFWAIGCTRQSETVRVQIQMPQFSANTSARQSHVNQLSTTNWGYDNPTGIADIDCFLVTISGTENDAHSISAYGGGTITNFGPYQGLLAQAQTVTFEISKGTRTVSVYGFSTANGSADCHGLETPLNKTIFSYPYLIGSTTTTVGSGDNEVRVDVSMTGATKMESSDIFNLSGTTLAKVAYVLTTSSTLEVVNLDTFSSVRVFPLGGSSINALAVDTARRRVWSGNSLGVEVYNADSGTFQDDILTITNIRGLKLAQDGSAMYALSDEGLTKIDPVTLATIANLPPVNSTNDQPVDLAISADGLKAARLIYDGSNPYVDLIDLSSMTIISRFALTTGVPSCSAQGNKVAFGQTGRILVADTNCDSLHQIDIGTLAEVPTDEVKLGRDGASGTGFLLYSASLGKAVQSKETMTSGNGGVGIMNPVGVTFSLVDGFPATTTTAGALSIDSNFAYISTYGFSGPTEAPILSKLNIASGVLSAPLFTFSTQGYAISHIIITQE